MHNRKIRGIWRLPMMKQKKADGGGIEIIKKLRTL